MEKQPAVRVSRLPTFAFLGCAGMHSTLLTGLSAAGLLGVAVDKVSRCVAIPALPAVREWHRQAGVSCAAKSPASFLLFKKGLLYMGLAQYSSPFLSIKSSYLPVSRKPTRRATVSVENQRGSCGFLLRPSREKAAQPSPQAWLSCKTKMQFLKLCAEQSGAHLKS